ncbi:MAG: hypothetical protein OXG81_17135 [Acidobacteria bacterium]|nr:hypothetical protein [Acidobacteriota bacterium]
MIRTGATLQSLRDPIAMQRANGAMIARTPPYPHRRERRDIRSGVRCRSLYSAGTV